MNNFGRKLMALGLAAVMTVSLAACTGGGTGSGTASSTGSGTEAKQTNFTIFAGVSALSPDNSEKPIVQQMNEAKGVTVDWNCVSGDTLTERKNLILNAGTKNLPDAFMAAQLTDNEILTCGSNGIFIPLEEYINEETMPNLWSVLQERPNALAACTMPDGHIYTLPSFGEMGFTYDKDDQE